MSLPAFGVRKPVPINLLMMAMVIGGLWAAASLRREFFPEIEPEQATVTMPYPGAAPEEVEESLAIKVEDKLAELDEVDRLFTNVSEGGGGITVEFREGLRDVDKAVDEVERAIDTLTDLPDEAETIEVRELEPQIPVIRVTIYGPAEERVIKRAIRAVRDDLRSLGGMGDISDYGVRDYEIRVDVRGGALIEHGISLPQIQQTISAWMAEVPGGTVRSNTGNFRVRTMGVAERAEAIRRIVLRSQQDGRALRVADIAQVTETFVDESLMLRLDGQPAATLTIFKVGNQDIVEIAEMARAYVDGRMGRPFTPKLVERFTNTKRSKAYQLGANSARSLPPGLSLTTNSDFARFVEGRIQLLVKNATYGALLVFATLLFFLNWRVALWVGVGLVIALMGTLILMKSLDITLNLLTMFGLIVVLGLLVDDAIVVSENIQSRHDSGSEAFTAAIKGAEQVTWPVTATVLTTVVAFAPLSFLKGSIGDLLGALPMVVGCALLMSLLESLLILPSHMGHSLEKRRRGSVSKFMQRLIRFEQKRDHIVFDRIVPGYAKLLAWSLRHRYLSICVALMMLTVSVGMIAGGRVTFTFMTESDAETIVVDLRLPIGTPIEQTDVVVQAIEQAAQNQPETNAVAAIIGQSSDLDTGMFGSLSSHVAQFFIELKKVEERTRHSEQVVASIRQALEGKIDEAERITYTQMSGGMTGPDISVRLRGENEQAMLDATADLKRLLGTFEGVYDISDDNSLGQRELKISLKDGAAALGFSTADVARQIRGALYGLDAHVFAAMREDIDVRVRLDEDTRRSLFAVENLWVISPAGQAVPLTEIATVHEGLAYATIKRVDRMRAVTVNADCSPGVSPETIVAQLPLDELRAQYPKIEIELTGRQEQMADAFGSLPWGFAAALVMIYVILAWLFSSYIQPVAVMLAIPFGLIGVIWGHLLLGFDLTFLSMIGFVALSGIVVNDSLILVDFYNQIRARNKQVYSSLVEAGRQRLRPICLTTITTVLGLTPLMLEQSFQARFLIPMAISISFGLLGTTAVILLVLPCVILIVDDAKNGLYYLWYGLPRPTEQPTEAAA